MIRMTARAASGRTGHGVPPRVPLGWGCSVSAGLWPFPPSHIQFISKLAACEKAGTLGDPANLQANGSTWAEVHATHPRVPWGNWTGALRGQVLGHRIPARIIKLYLEKHLHKIASRGGNIRFSSHSGQEVKPSSEQLGWARRIRPIIAFLESLLHHPYMPSQKRSWVPTWGLCSQGSHRHYFRELCLASETSTHYSR